MYDVLFRRHHKRIEVRVGGETNRRILTYSMVHRWKGLNLA